MTDDKHIKEMSKAMFLYKAAEAGWVVRKTSKDRYEFSRPVKQSNTGNSELHSTEVPPDVEIGMDEPATPAPTTSEDGANPTHVECDDIVLSEFLRKSSADVDKFLRKVDSASRTAISQTSARRARV